MDGWVVGVALEFIQEERVRFGQAVYKRNGGAPPSRVQPRHGARPPLKDTPPGARLCHQPAHPMPTISPIAYIPHILRTGTDGTTSRMGAEPEGARPSTAVGRPCCHCSNALTLAATLADLMCATNALFEVTDTAGGVPACDRRRGLATSIRSRSAGAARTLAQGGVRATHPGTRATAGSARHRPRLFY